MQIFPETQHFINFLYVSCLSTLQISSSKLPWKFVFASTAFIIFLASKMAFFRDDAVLLVPLVSIKQFFSFLFFFVNHELDLVGFPTDSVAFELVFCRCFRLL